MDRRINNYAYINMEKWGDRNISYIDINIHINKYTINSNIPLKRYK